MDCGITYYFMLLAIANVFPIYAGSVLIL